MEDIFDRIVEGVKKGASTVIKGAGVVAEKGEQLVELTKLRAARARLEDQLSKAYEDLGRELYEMVQKDHIISDTLRARCAVIGHIQAQIADNLAKEAERTENMKKDGPKDEPPGPSGREEAESKDETEPSGEKKDGEDPEKDPPKSGDDKKSTPDPNADDYPDDWVPESDEEFGVC